jgi:ethylmalonyl-CoA/methylmalonyl-CoA decarboxylase
MSSAAAFRALVSPLPRGPGRVRVEPGVVARITIDAPTRKNALDPAMMVDFADAAAAVAGARVVILRGEGEAFCAGGDLGAVRENLAVPGLGALLGAFMAGAVGTLEASGAVLVAAVTGPAMGGGAELLAACDVVFASPAARVGWVQARLGVSPGFGGGARLVRRVGRARALRLLAEADLLDASAARAAGLVDEVVADPVAAAEAWAARAVEVPAEALRGAVRVVRAAGEPEGEATELAVFAELWGGPAHVAALERARGARRA